MLEQPSAHHPADRAFPLSTREAEVLEMASFGLTNLQIADRLHVSIHAVKFHLAAVYRKLGVTNRTEAAFVYLRAASGRPAGDRPL